MVIAVDNAQTFLKVTRASDIKPQRQKWLYAPNNEGVIPLQTGTVFAGIGGEGKSSFAIYLAALLSRGALEGDLYGQTGRTIIFGPEDDWATAMLPRLMAADADCDKILKVSAETFTPYGAQERELKFPLDIQHLEDVVSHNAVKLIVVDPISTSMAGDMNKVQDVRDALGALTSLAQKYDLAVIVINHFNKGGNSVANRMSGSHAMRDVVRSYLAFATDDETGERIITQDKSNYSTSSGSWKFRLQNTPVHTDDGIAEVPAVQMLGSSDVTVKDLIDRESHDDGDDDRSAAQAFILDFIKEQDDGEAKAGDVIKAGRGAGFTENEIKNARRRSKDPKIVTGKSAFGAGWVWQLEDSPDSEDAAQDPQGVTKVPKVSHSQDTTPSTPSSQKLTPSMGASPTEECPLHGTDYFPECYTCDKIMNATPKTASAQDAR